MALLEVENLSTHFFTRGGIVRAVDGVSFSVESGETLGIVGESGSGKSVTALSLIRLLDPPGRVVGGSVRLEGQDLLTMPESEMLHIRGQKMAMVFQDPMTSLNPTVRVGEQILEALKTETYNACRAGPWPGFVRFVRDRIRPDREYEQAKHSEAIRLLESVHMPDPEVRFSEFPYMLSGGMVQRIMIAIALASGPRILIADEPTTALDVTMEAQILRILRERKDQLQLSMILITHDLGVIAETCDRVVVMYAGRIVEEGRVEDIFTSPSHPYTLALIASVPRLDEDRDRLEAIEGAVPDLVNLAPDACHFHPRCPFATDICRTALPPPTQLPTGQTVRCHLYSHPAMRVSRHELTAAHPSALSQIESKDVAHASSSSSAADRSQRTG